MRLVFALDRNVLQHLAVALLSVCETHRNIDIEVLLILVGVPPNDVDRLRELAGQFPNVNMHYVPFTIEHPERFPVKKGHISVAAYARIFIADLVPSSWTKALYLDCDVIVRRNLAEIWDLDLDGFAGAGARDPGNARNAELGLDQAAPYINSGVMLINLEYWRRHDVKSLLLDYISRFPEKLLFWDQDAINACLSLKLLLLPRRWNVTHVYYLGPFRDLSGISARDLFTLQRDPYVVHFTGPTKPWMYIMTHPFQDTYWQLLRRTPFRDAQRDKITAGTFLFRHLRIAHRAVKRNALIASSAVNKRAPPLPALLSDRP